MTNFSIDHNSPQQLAFRLRMLLDDLESLRKSRLVGYASALDLQKEDDLKRISSRVLDQLLRSLLDSSTIGRS